MNPEDTHVFREAIYLEFVMIANVQVEPSSANYSALGNNCDDVVKFVSMLED
jgi:hypothetical protein